MANGNADGTNDKTHATKLFVTLIAAVPTAFSAILGYFTFQTSHELEQLKEQRRFDLEIYEAAKEALDGSESQQKAALALVVSLGQPPLKDALIEAFYTSETSDPEVTSLAATYRPAQEPAQEEEEEEEAQAPAPAVEMPGSAIWSNWDFDLFYCASSPQQARVQADRVADRLKQDGAQGRVRVRELSAEVNARSGYRIQGYAIRRSEDEAEIADQLAAFADQVLADSNVSFETQASGQQTPWYVSAFFCPAA